MWRTSGHYACYGENMYLTEIDEQEYGIKPMNCIGHIQIFKQSGKSYRDLPLKYYEYGVVHRHEKSGVLHGLFRVREFTQDDAHIFCTPEQIAGEVIKVVEFVDSVMKLFDFEYTMEISTKPDKAIGDDAVWEMATEGLKTALTENSLLFTIDEGGGAFYGPKIDVKITDAIGRKWQCGTIQVDFNLPERFGAEYVAEDNTRKQPVMIHRAILGSFERFIGILTEHYAGEFPLFLAPTQVIIVPISDSHISYAMNLKSELMDIEIDCEIFDKNDSLNKRIRNAEEGIRKLQQVSDTVIVVDNNRLLQLVPNLPLDQAFAVADEVISKSVKGITETITVPSLMNLDYADIRAVMTNGGVSMISVGEARGHNRVQEAVDLLGKQLVSPVKYKHSILAKADEIDIFIEFSGVRSF